MLQEKKTHANWKTQQENPLNEKEIKTNEEREKNETNENIIPNSSNLD